MNKRKDGGRRCLAAAMCLCLGLGLLGSPSPCRADTASGVDGDVEQMGTLVVTGSRTPTDDPAKLPVPVQVITRHQLQEIGAVSLDQALEVIQGVELIQSPDLNAAPGVKTLRMRGMDANHVLVLIDGRRQPGSRPDNQGFSFTDISTIDINNVERIEVLRDGASAQYGSDAVAGVINIVMQKQNPRLTLNSQYGQATEGDGEEKQVDVAGGVPVGERFFINVGANGLVSDHYDRTPENPRWTAPDIEQAGANLNLSFDIDYRQMVAADLRYNWTETVLRRGVSGEVPQDRISKKRDQYGGLTYEGDFAPFGIELGGGVADSNNEYRHSEDPDYNGDLESDVYDGFLHLNWDAAPWLGLFGGASYNREDVDSPQRDFVETREVIALFLETRLTLFDRLSVQLSGRMEDYSDFGVNFAPKISGRCEVASWLALRASVSRSYQVPTLYQLHDRFIGAMGWNDIYGNPDLEPAEGINYNLGVVWTPFKNSDIQLSADLYHNRIDNMIDTEAVSENTADANAVTTYENIEGTSTFSGVEANLILPLLYGFRLDLTANYLEARDPDDEDLTNRPRSRLNATLSYRFRDKLRANLRYNYRGKYLSDKEPHQRIDPFDYFNAQITYQIFPAVSLFIGGRNLLDEDPPVDVADYEGGHMESMIDSPLGAFYYGGLRLTI